MQENTQMQACSGNCSSSQGNNRSIIQVVSDLKVVMDGVDSSVFVLQLVPVTHNPMYHLWAFLKLNAEVCNASFLFQRSLRCCWQLLLNCIQQVLHE